MPRCERRGGCAGRRFVPLCGSALHQPLPNARPSPARQVGTGPANWNSLERVSYVRLKGRWVAYPFQNNVSALEVDDQVACLKGMVEAKVLHATSAQPPKDFDEWILRTQGAGIADLFMRPYNFKVWAVPTTMMQCGWLGERVAAPDVGRAISNVLHGKEDAGWGPNAVFRFPTQGGTGGIWKAVAKLLPAERQHYGPHNAVVSIDAAAKRVTLASGAQLAYGSLISTIPLDITLRMLGKPEWADGLTHSSSHIIGVGIRGGGAAKLGKKCWLYFPEDNCPFYRATVFSLYAIDNCPGEGARVPTLCLGDGRDVPAGQEAKAGPYWSLMFEVSESFMKKVNQEPTALGGKTWPALVKECLLGAVATELMSADDEVVSLYHRRLEHGYPTPSLGRDGVLAQALPWLRKQGIWSRGRFGSYKYEVANQDHSLMIGVEAADNVTGGNIEITLTHPSIVNQTRNTEILYHQ